MLTISLCNNYNIPFFLVFQALNVVYTCIHYFFLKSIKIFSLFIMGQAFCSYIINMNHFKHDDFAWGGSYEGRSNNL